METRNADLLPSVLLISLFAFLTVVIPVNAQDKPVFTEYRGVAIGMSADEVRAKLGRPKDQSDTEDNYEFENNESARIIYEEDRTVRTIAILFSGNLRNAPAPKSVIGSDIEARDDGGMHRMVQYPKHGFWVSYSKTGGSDPLVSIMMQKMPKLD
jgi:ABC-type microcin C transport system permease subunit YejE